MPTIGSSSAGGDTKLRVDCTFDCALLARRPDPPPLSGDTYFSLSACAVLQVPIRFGSTANCLPPMASRRLQVHSVKCTKTSSRADNSRQAVPAKPAAAAAQAGSLQGGCNRADGTYLVVVGVPSAVGQHSCSVTFNDDWEDRRLAELRVI